MGQDAHVQHVRIGDQRRAAGRRLILRRRAGGRVAVVDLETRRVAARPSAAGERAEAGRADPGPAPWSGRGTAPCERGSLEQRLQHAPGRTAASCPRPSASRAARRAPRAAGRAPRPGGGTAARCPRPPAPRRARGAAARAARRDVGRGARRAAGGARPSAPMERCRSRRSTNGCIGHRRARRDRTSHRRRRL